MRAPLTTRLLLALLLASLTPTYSQEAATVSAYEQGAGVYVEVTSLARALGVVVQQDGSALTWRGADGPIILFAGSPDALVQFPGDAGPTDVALAAPVQLRAGSWFVPLDALPLLGIQVPSFGGRPDYLTLPDGRQVALVYQPPGAEGGSQGGVDGAPPEASTDGTHVPGTTGRASWEPAEAPLAGVRFFDGDGVSLLLVDLALVPLAAPVLTGDVDDAIDRARAAGNDHVLLLMVTSVAELPWTARLVFTQDDRRIEVGPPYRMLIEAGTAGAASPGSPVIGAVLLPPSFSLYRDMLVEWAGVQAVVRFRK